QTVCPGSSAGFSVSATGTSLSYQWLHDGSPLSGATGSNLNLANVQPGDAGRYDVVVSGICGGSQTVGAMLTGNMPVVVNGGISDQTVCAGGNVGFSISASGTGLSYQWYKGASALAGQTGSSLSLNNVSASDAGSYSVTVSGTCGNSITSSATLT